MTVALEAENVRLQYGDLTAVWGASFTAHEGRICGLIGRNGAGKTTLLSGVMGLVSQSEGRFAVFGRDMRGLPTHKRVKAGVTLVQEGKRIFRALSVEENLRLGIRRSDRSSTGTLLEEMYERFPALAPRRRERAAHLSGGQQQMLALAQALVARPKILLIDEPSSGLAPIVVAELHSTIRRLRDEGLTIVLVEEQIDEVLSGLADDIVLVDGGRVVLSGPASDFSLQDISSKMQLSGLV